MAGTEGVCALLAACLSPFGSHCYPTLLQLKIKACFFGINCWRCLFFSEHPSQPGKLAQAVGGSVSRGMGTVGEHQRCPHLVAGFSQIRALPWKHKSTENFCCMVHGALPGRSGVTIHPCWDGVGEFITTPHLRASSMP